MNIPIFETLREAAYDEGTKLLSGVILESGLSKNGNYYPPDTIAKAAGKFFGVKCFIDHQFNGNVGQRSIRDVCGVVEECRAESGRLHAVIHISETHDWIASMIREGILGDVSINALGRTKLSRRDGRVVREVIEISKAYSVDFVTEAAAGGHVGALLKESAEFCEGLRLIENMTLAELKETRPDLIDRIIGEMPDRKVADLTDATGAANATGPAGAEDVTRAAIAELDIMPILEGVLGARNLPPYIATYLREHFKHIHLNTSTAPKQADLNGPGPSNSTIDPTRLIQQLVEQHLDYLGGLADNGMIRSLSPYDHLSDRTHSAKLSTFKFLGIPSSPSRKP